MKRIIITTFSLLLLTSCIDEKENEKINNEPKNQDSTSLNFELDKEDTINDYDLSILDSISIRNNFFNEIIEYDLPIYNINSNDELIEIDTVKSGENVIFIAQDQLGIAEYIPETTIYLIKRSLDKQALWSGWVRMNEISGTNYNNIYKKGNDLSFIQSRQLTSDSKILATTTKTYSYDGMLKILSQEGDLIFQTLINEIGFTWEYTDPYHLTILGWSHDKKMLWAYFGYESSLLAFCVFETEGFKSTIFDKPKQLKGKNFKVNCNTGEIMYSGYPITFDESDKEEIKETGEIFTLYKYNFFTELLEEVDSNVGNNFNIEITNDCYIYEKR